MEGMEERRMSIWDWSAARWERASVYCVAVQVGGAVEDMVAMGAVNEAVEHARLEEVALGYAADIARQSPQAIRMLKFAFNLADDGLAGQQVFAGEATRLAYMTDEAVEGRDAFLQKRDPDWSAFPYYF